MTTPLYAQGSTVVCERCLESLYRVTRDLYAQDYLSMDMFEPIPPQTLKPHVVNTCHRCSHYVSFKMIIPSK